MSQVELWLRRPQNLWLRRAVFQIHLWSGIILGIYIFLVSVSGSAIVFRNELYNLLSARTRVNVSGEPLTREQMIRAVERAYPGYTVQSIHRGRFAEEATDISFAKGWIHKERLFDPFLGRDIGPSVEIYFSMLHWVGDLHGNLLFGEMGLLANGIGGFLLAAMAVAGMVVWWPGIANWRRSMTIRRDVGWKRLNWDLHSAIGFWTFALIFMWGLTGAYFPFPEPFRAAIEHFTPINPPPTKQVARAPQTVPAPSAVAGAPRPAFTYTVRRGPRRPPTKGQKILQWFSYLHYGNFAGWPVKVLWMVLGFAPPALFVTSLLMWWNRVLSPAARRFLRGPQSAPVEPELEESRPIVT